MRRAIALTIFGPMLAITPLLSTVLLDPQTALLFGCAVALVSARLLARNPGVELRRTAAIGAGWGVLYGLSVGWFFFTQPDWMFAYLKDAREVPLLPAYGAFLAVLATFGAAGALANAALLERGHRGAAWMLTLGAIASIGAGFYLQADQYVLVGTWEQYQAGAATPLPSLPSMQTAMNVSGAVSAGSAIAIFVLRFLQSRKVAPPHNPRALQPLRD